ncbi:ABC transporter permease [Thermomonospora sp. CIF 1]|mgnify:CR=1 FL=1|uniref:ABC transporter permease n=1 Tax=Thermomonospora sp. CIF 1 TaxID=1916083 RepID=UPI000A52F152|nr:ABC transporter permease [Thermomonospora sp. CIF 1]PKK12859.1 MAG: ABC transporter [Thermomonospora sp. CIF 1]
MRFLRRIPLPADLAAEVAAGLLVRPGRLALTAAGTVLGIAALVATLGLAATAGNHIVTRFDELAATEVVVQPAHAGEPGEEPAGVLPWDAQTRLERLNGVRAAGTLTKIETGDLPIRSVALEDPLAAALPQTPVLAASPGLRHAVRGELAAGRWFDRGHDARRSRVAVIGQGLARRLNIAQPALRPAVFIGDEAFTVIGILKSAAREATLTDSIILPDGTARDLYGLDHPEKVYIDTAIGAARLIARQAPTALAPHAPDSLVAQMPPEPALVRARVSGDVQAMLVLLGGLSLIVGGFGIANTTLVSVMERRGEIALRRSLGAQRRQIAVQFLVESAAIGLLGGIVGASLGVVVTVAVAAVQSWTPVLAAWLPLAGIGFGALIGLLAGAYPALRAARLEPIDVLRGEG